MARAPQPSRPPHNDFIGSWKTKLTDKKCNREECVVAEEMQSLLGMVLVYRSPSTQVSSQFMYMLNRVYYDTADTGA